IADAMASHAVGDGFAVFAAVENLFNTHYYTAATTFSGAAVASPPQLGLPITARFGFRFDFPKR
ncbi:MAG TPA: hypothetical protein VJN69_05910, partial [Candidatus Acidoferrales bacterium]|nr:hypothetical protein [Candidatus Acidoferrales bacterium]